LSGGQLVTLEDAGNYITAGSDGGPDPGRGR
jgi:hypothetical protein